MTAEALFGHVFASETLLLCDDDLSGPRKDTIRSETSHKHKHKASVEEQGTLSGSFK